MSSPAPNSMDQISSRFQEVLSTLANFRTQITAVQNEIRSLEKEVAREMRVFKREAAKQKPKGARKPSGFAKPTAISEDLCSFMNKTTGAQVARTEVTRFLINYIKDKGLQNADDKREIVPDPTLRSLLGLDEGQHVSYFELQRHMNRHFPKAEKS